MSVADVPVAQLDRALDSDSKGQRFESSRVRHKNPRKQDVFGGFVMLAKAISLLQNCGIYYNLCAEGGESCFTKCSGRRREKAIYYIFTTIIIITLILAFLSASISSLNSKSCSDKSIDFV